MAERKSKRAPSFTDRDKRNLRWIWDKYLKPKTPLMAIVLALIVVQGLVYQQFLALSETGMRTIFEHGNFDQLLWVSAAVFGLFAVRGITSYVNARLAAWIASDAVSKIRRDLIKVLLAMDLEYFEKTKTGDIILKMVQQTQTLATFVGVGVITAVSDLVMIVIIGGYLIYQQPVLFLSGIIVYPVVMIILQYTANQIKSIQRNSEAAIGAYISGIEEAVNGMRTVKISGQEDAEKTRLNDSTDNIKSLMYNVASAKALVLPTMDFASAFAYILVIGGGGYMVLSPNFDVDGAAIITFLIGVILVFDPGRRLAQFFATLQAQLIILDSVHGFSEMQPTITDTENAHETFATSNDIVFKDVSFAYKPGQELFSKLNLQIAGGKTTAIVGSTGSGKTTILSLLGRLYEIEQGEILVGGTNIKDIKISALRSAFSIVAQDVVIFNNSIWENIKYVAPEASDDDIWAAAEAAEIADLIRERGAAVVGPKGAQLSGGQRQRIAIARAFLRNAPIVILDEATSALDQRTEEKVKVALSRLSKAKTTITVAHKLSSVVAADRIYVLEAGKVVEQGTHQELIEADGLYANMFLSQKKSFEEQAQAQGDAA